MPFPAKPFGKKQAPKFGKKSEPDADDRKGVRTMKPKRSSPRRSMYKAS